MSGMDEELYQIYNIEFSEISANWKNGKITKDERNVMCSILFKNREFYNKFLEYCEQRKCPKKLMTGNVNILNKYF